MKLQEADSEKLKGQLKELQEKYEAYQSRKLELNISRGLPSEELLDLNDDAPFLLSK